VRVLRRMRKPLLLPVMRTTDVSDGDGRTDVWNTLAEEVPPAFAASDVTESEPAPLGSRDRRGGSPRHDHPERKPCDQDPRTGTPSRPVRCVSCELVPGRTPDRSRAFPELVRDERTPSQSGYNEMSLDSSTPHSQQTCRSHRWSRRSKRRGNPVDYGECQTRMNAPETRFTWGKIAEISRPLHGKKVIGPHGQTVEMENLPTLI